MNKFLKGLCVVLFLVLVFLTAVLAMLIVNHGSEGEETVDSYHKGSYKEYSLTDEYLKFIGRSAEYDGKVYFSYSGSGIEFICKGAYAEITLCAENVGAYKNHQPRVAVYADGNLIVDETVSYEEKTYRVDTSYSGTKITLIKLSEAMYSSFAVSKVASYGMEDIEPTAENDIKIEFIGDSITAGYGIDEGSYGSFSTVTENFSKTYAYLTARKLNADYSAVCFSGYGVLSGYTENGYKNDKLVMNEYGKACLISGAELLWNFSKAENNLVVVNLGTNDASYCSDSFERRQMFVESYVDLLKEVREHNPHAYILCILGDMNNSLYSSIESAVTLYSSETGDSRAEAYSISFKMSENDIVINGHPGEKSNEYASEILTSKIANLIELGYIR